MPHSDIVGQVPGFRALCASGSHPLCIVLLCAPQGGSCSLAVRGQLQVIRPNFEEVQQVWAAGDLDGQSHEGVEVLCERSLTTLSGTLPIKPSGCWVGAPETHEHTHKVKSKCMWEGVLESRAGAGDPADGLSRAHRGGVG